MAGYSVWSAQALQNLDGDGPFKVKYCQGSREVLEEVQDSGATITREFGDPKFYYPKDPNEKPSRFSSVAIGAMPNSEPHRLNYGEPKYPKNIRQGKREYDAETILPKLFDDHFHHPQDRHQRLQKRIATIEDFLESHFPSWKEFLKKIQENIPFVPKHHRRGGTLDKPDSESEGMPYKYALIFGETTEFNPSGIWVAEEFYNNDDM